MKTTRSDKPIRVPISVQLLVGFTPVGLTC